MNMVELDHVLERQRRQNGRRAAGLEILEEPARPAPADVSNGQPTTLPCASKPTPWPLMKAMLPP